MDDQILPISRSGQNGAEPSLARSPAPGSTDADSYERDPPIPNPLKWTVFVLSGVFLLLGAFFLVAPRSGAGFYGLDADTPSALLYVRAIGLRDAALALYLFGLALAELRRALRIVAFGTLIIPLGDILLLATSGAGDPVHYLLHAGGLICFAGIAWWSSLPPRLG